MGICGKVDPEGSHPEDEKHDLQMELGSSRYDEVCVSAYIQVYDEGLCESSRSACQ